MSSTAAQPQIKTYDVISFALRVEQLVAEGIEDSYISAVSMVLEEMDCDPEEGKHLISKTLVEKMQAEALQRRLLKDRPTTRSIMDFAT